LNKAGYLLDTDVLIAFLRGKNVVLKQQIGAWIQQDIPVYMSIISLGELYLGAFKSQNPPKNLSLVNLLKEQVDILTLTENVVLLYGEIEAVLEKSGLVIGDFDVLIASTAIAHGLVLVSGNARHFERITTLFGQLDFEKWAIN